MSPQKPATPVNMLSKGADLGWEHHRTDLRSHTEMGRRGLP